jgi:hypothetical protein
MGYCSILVVSDNETQLCHTWRREITPQHEYQLAPPNTYASPTKLPELEALILDLTLTQSDIIFVVKRLKSTQYVMSAYLQYLNADTENLIMLGSTPLTIPEKKDVYYEVMLNGSIYRSYIHHHQSTTNGKALLAPPFKLETKSQDAQLHLKAVCLFTLKFYTTQTVENNVSAIDYGFSLAKDKESRQTLLDVEFSTNSVSGSPMIYVKNNVMRGEILQDDIPTLINKVSAHYPGDLPQDIISPYDEPTSDNKSKRSRRELPRDGDAALESALRSAFGSNKKTSDNQKFILNPQKSNTLMKKIKNLRLKLESEGKTHQVSQVVNLRKLFNARFISQEILTFLPMLTPEDSDHWRSTPLFKSLSSVKLADGKPLVLSSTAILAIRYGVQMRQWWASLENKTLLPKDGSNAEIQQTHLMAILQTPPTERTAENAKLLRYLLTHPAIANNAFSVVVLKSASQGLPLSGLIDKVDPKNKTKQTAETGNTKSGGSAETGNTKSGGSAETGNTKSGGSAETGNTKSGGSAETGNTNGSQPKSSTLYPSLGSLQTSQLSSSNFKQTPKPTILSHIVQEQERQQQEKQQQERQQQQQERQQQVRQQQERQQQERQQQERQQQERQQQERQQQERQQQERQQQERQQQERQQQPKTMAYGRMPPIPSTSGQQNRPQNPSAQTTKISSPQPTPPSHPPPPVPDLLTYTVIIGRQNQGNINVRYKSGLDATNLVDQDESIPIDIMDGATLRLINASTPLSLIKVMALKVPTILTDTLLFYCNENSVFVFNPLLISVDSQISSSDNDSILTCFKDEGQLQAKVFPTISFHHTTGRVPSSMLDNNPHLFINVYNPTPLTWGITTITYNQKVIPNTKRSSSIMMYNRLDQRRYHQVNNPLKGGLVPQRPKTPPLPTNPQPTAPLQHAMDIDDNSDDGSEMDYDVLPSESNPIRSVPKSTDVNNFVIIFESRMWNTINASVSVKDTNTWQNYNTFHFNRHKNPTEEGNILFSLANSSDTMSLGPLPTNINPEEISYTYVSYCKDEDDMEGCLSLDDFSIGRKSREMYPQLQIIIIHQPYHEPILSPPSTTKPNACPHDNFNTCQKERYAISISYRPHKDSWQDLWEGIIAPQAHIGDQVYATTNMMNYVTMSSKTTIQEMKELRRSKMWDTYLAPQNRTSPQSVTVIYKTDGQFLVSDLYWSFPKHISTQWVYEFDATYPTVCDIMRQHLSVRKQDPDFVAFTEITMIFLPKEKDGVAVTSCSIWLTSDILARIKGGYRLQNPSLTLKHDFTEDGCRICFVYPHKSVTIPGEVGIYDHSKYKNLDNLGFILSHKKRGDNMFTIFVPTTHILSPADNTFQEGCIIVSYCPNSQDYHIYTTKVVNTTNGIQKNGLNLLAPKTISSNPQNEDPHMAQDLKIFKSLPTLYHGKLSPISKMKISDLTGLMMGSVLGGLLGIGIASVLTDGKPTK